MYAAKEAFKTCPYNWSTQCYVRVRQELGVINHRYEDTALTELCGM